MAPENSLQELRNWFEDYVAAFNIKYPDDVNISLKHDHTNRVCKEIIYIAAALELKDTDLLLAEVMALFHDIGRFEQYAQYHTFADPVSVNHAEFGVEILKEKQILKHFNQREQNLIFRAIAYHNRRDLPENETEQCLFFSKMLRDADKLDIWQVFAAYYISDKVQDKTPIHNLPDTPGISDPIFQELKARRIANYSDVKNLNDFKLLQIGWVYDVNFMPTFKRIRERRYLESIRAALPESAQIDELFCEAQSYFDTMIENIK